MSERVLDEEHFSLACMSLVTNNPTTIVDVGQLFISQANLEMG